MKNRSTSAGSSAGISAWSIQLVPAPRTLRGHASGFSDPVSVPVNSISVYSSITCSDGSSIRTPSPTVRFSPLLTRLVVAPNRWLRCSNLSRSAAVWHLYPSLTRPTPPSSSTSE